MLLCDRLPPSFLEFVTPPPTPSNFKKLPVLLGVKVLIFFFCLITLALGNICLCLCLPDFQLLTFLFL